MNLTTKGKVPYVYDKSSFGYGSPVQQLFLYFLPEFMLINYFRRSKDFWSKVESNEIYDIYSIYKIYNFELIWMDTMEWYQAAKGAVEGAKAYLKRKASGNPRIIK